MIGKCHRARAAVGDEKVHLVVRQVCRGGERHEPGRNRTEEQQRIGAGVIEPDQQPVALLEAACAEGVRDGQNGSLDLGKGPAFGSRRGIDRIMNDKRDFVGGVQRCLADDVARHVEALGHWRTGKA